VREGDGAYEAPVRFGEGHQGGPGLAHGGLVAAALDEACGLLATWYRFPTVTSRLDVRYRRPVAINSDLTIRAAIHADRGRQLFVRGELVGPDTVLAEARCVFTHVPLEHFLVTPEGRALGEAWHRSQGGGAMS
jgi:acyl-coenzyme A thioesterase PaaI-like protein